jgi:tetratricopeptide (TPR) repeat protein
VKLLPVLLLLLWSTSARAQVAGTAPAPPDEVERLKTSAYSAFRAGQYREAAKGFTALYQKTKDANSLFNIAKCYEKLSEYGQAVGYLREYLLQKPQAPDRQAVNRLIIELSQAKEALQGKLDISSVPPGARVFLRGRLLGVTPLIARLQPGKHVLRFEKIGYKNHNVPLELLPTANLPLAIAMEALLAKLHLRCTISGATILVDGETRGVTPLARPIELQHGPHQVSVKKAGYIAWERALVLQAGREQIIDVTLMPLTAGAGKTEGPSIKSIVGWSSIGLAVVSEALAWVFYAKSNEHLPSYPEYGQNRNASIGLHIGAGITAALGASLLIWRALELRNQRTEGRQARWMLSPTGALGRF